MRSIGEIDDQELASDFCGYLNNSSIQSEIEQEEQDGPWTVWVHHEEKLEEAKAELKIFRGNATDPKYKKAAQKAAAQQREQEKADGRQRKRDRKLARRIQGSTTFPVTYTLMGISIATYLMQIAGGEIPLVIQLFAYHTESILAGQFWRVLTPIFLHFGFLHIFFNMWWMLDLGRTLENYHSSRFLLTFTLASGIGSNLFQALLESNTLFGGMSGVVYALLGYIWMKARFQPGSGLYIPPFIVTLMLVWLALGFSMQNIANGAHAGGLLIGTLWGYLSATKATGR